MGEIADRLTQLARQKEEFLDHRAGGLFNLWWQRVSELVIEALLQLAAIALAERDLAHRNFSITMQAKLR